MAGGALARAWASGLLPPIDLDAGAFERVALRGKHPAVLGADSGWREPYHRLVAALREEADLNPLGRAMAHGQIVQSLRARIRAVHLWQHHPEILARPIVAPIVIVGPMRSGTTRLHRLLARDRRFSHTRFFESMIPVPLRGPRPDSRPWRARAALRALQLLNPALAAIHPSSPGEAEEEFGLFSFAFGSPQFEAQWRIPSFVAWWEAADPVFLYREFKALLQTIAWARDEPTDRPWLLKAPQFMADLPALLAVFPDARLIFLDRDEEAVVASSASLVWHQMRIQSDSADTKWIGQEWLRKTRLRRERALAARHAYPDVPSIEVGYDRMNSDWRGEMRRIYAFLGLTLNESLEQSMAKWLASSRRHLGHRYALEEFGLAREMLARPALALIASLSTAM